MKEIYLAGGCFWGTEHFFKQVKGVTETEVGYANGITENPTYEDVCTDKTQFAETVHVVYDPQVITLEFLLNMYFKAIDPTSLNQQGHDKGTQYRTGIYYVSETDLPTIQKVFQEQQKLFDKPLAVEVKPLENFYNAEDYHQDYLDKNPQGYCHLPLELFAYAKKAVCTMILLLTVLSLSAQNVVKQVYKQVNDIRYTQKSDAYAQERLLLDVYYPEGLKDCPVVVWFHGGGLEAGQKEIPQRLKEKGWVVVGVNYRLLPKVKVDETLDDAAEAVAWVFRHIETYGGCPKKITVTGHSAGGYIGMMLCLNKAWLARYDINADDVMLYAPFSGQAITHYNVRKMQGINPLQPTIDEYAPLYWVRNDCPPLVLICGDRELELYGRYDENQYLARMMKLVGHQQTYLYEIDGHGHGEMVEPSFHILETHIKQLLNN